MAELNGFFFEEQMFHAAPEPGGAHWASLDEVMAQREGNCVGLATVYLILAQELGFPIHAVATPGHVFLRWDDGRSRRNIELLERGRDVPDSFYVEREAIPVEVLTAGVFLSNLSWKEFLGLVHQNRGVSASQRGAFSESEREYRRALRLNPRLAATWYNLGNDFLAQGRYGKAVRSYANSLRLNPMDEWTRRNLRLACQALPPGNRTPQDRVCGSANG